MASSCVVSITSHVEKEKGKITQICEKDFLLQLTWCWKKLIEKVKNDKHLCPSVSCCIKPVAQRRRRSFLDFWWQLYEWQKWQLAFTALSVQYNRETQSQSQPFFGPNSNCDEDEILICLTFPFLFCVHLRLLFEMESTLVDIEHTIFKNSKTDIGYKTTMLKKVPWINVLKSWPFQFR